ncbi:MAG TPA: NAD(P)/FAD-dependent oxidoreductase [Nitrospiria bacterium]|jgi:geranylgeranyl reductase family protein|nr:NAD(P)/FAD-dependent oxidoreductase [Nitrospiria bacterium]
MRDVVIVGAGPAGSAMARSLAEEGLDVLLFEEHAEAGDGVICTGVIGREAFERFDLPNGAILGRIDRVRFHSPSGKTVDYRAGSPLAMIVCRKKFDSALARRAVEAGAELRTGSRVRNIAVGTEGVRVEWLRDGEPHELRARLCVLATGFGSGLIRRCGFPGPRHRVQAAQAVIPFRDRKEAGIYLGARFAPRGFGWSVPIGGGLARIGVVTDRLAAQYLRRILRRTEVRSLRTADTGGAVRIQACPIPVGTLDETVADRLMVVGEAAGQVKTTTQGGIYYGLLCAETAARAAVGAFRAGDLSRAALSPYDRSWRARLGAELRLGLLLREFYSGLSDRQVDRLFDLAGLEGVLPLIERKVHFDWHGPVIRSVLNDGFLGAAVRSMLGVAPLPTV